MTHTELVARVAKDSGLPRETVARVLRCLIQATKKTLTSGSDVRLRAFGRFYTVTLKKKNLFGGIKETSVTRFKETRHGKIRHGA